MGTMSDSIPAAPHENVPHQSEPLLAHPSVIRVREVLRRHGTTGQVRVLHDHARTAAQAAQHLGVEVAQIANSLVFSVPDEQTPEGSRPLLVLTSGAHRVDTARVAELIGAPRLDRADADFVKRHTGFAIGGVAPVGHTHPPQTLIDVSLAPHDVVWAAAGHPRTVFPTTFEELLSLTGGMSAAVA
jgi:prolyl-tRNA editing enzyme YbaK/EbsC (Cys-tRNA(Pro) deacylase)